jgi:2-polyprenyl-6-methoxyphenol hydroxylase-like FAD-dependent oxidoreductase
VTAHFDDGSTATGDVLIAADGANSVVRSHCGIPASLRDLGVRTIFGRIPITDELRATVLPELQDRFTWVIGSDGHKLGLMPMVFRSTPAEAAERFWPGWRAESPGDYLMSVFSMHRMVLGRSEAEFLSMDRKELWDLVRQRTEGWHPALREILRHADIAETFPVVVRAAVPVEPWPYDNIVPLGDAVHAMPPSGGVGANTAVRDASALTRALAAVQRGERSLADAVRGYQAEMVAHATEATATSLRIAKWSLQTIDFDESAL